MSQNLELVIQIFVAAVLGGIVGYERERLKRPAGLRTHILVCVGSTIAMQTNIFLVAEYINIVNVDPSRIGASVVSGIGFLGAGTIIREGASVKGLTTAASLWAVACIGLAIGSGFYIGGIAATVIVILTLTLFFRFRKSIRTTRSHYALEILTKTDPGQLGRIGTTLGKLNIIIDDIEMEPHDKELTRVMLSVKPPRDIIITRIITIIGDIEGIQSVSTID